MKLWKQLVVSFVVALILPSFGFLSLGIFDGAFEEMGSLLLPTIIGLVNTSFQLWGIVFFLLNWLIVFGVVFLFTRFRKKLLVSRESGVSH